MTTRTDPRPQSVVSNDWQADAACAKVADPDTFHPPKGVSSAAPKILCREWCPVRYDCLANALELNERAGVRGGYAARERRPLHVAFRQHIAPPKHEYSE